MVTNERMKINFSVLLVWCERAYDRWCTVPIKYVWAKSAEALDSAVFGVCQTSEKDLAVILQRLGKHLCTHMSVNRPHWGYLPRNAAHCSDPAEKDCNALR